MPYFVLEKNSDGEILKLPICFDCESTIIVSRLDPQAFRAFIRLNSSESYSTTEYFVRQGCAVCRLILAIFQSPGYLPPSYIDPGRVMVSSTQQTLPWPKNCKSAEIVVLEPEQAGIHKFDIPVESHKINDSSGSTTSITLARRWLRDCINNHERCKSAIESNSRLPSRLLQISFSKTKHRYHVRLCTSTILPHAKYATLSHVWGSTNFVKLLNSNLSYFQEDIPLSSLTKTFQDTVKVALKFGFHYLWIDSLCIIQDDANDWLKESALMADVYGGSSLNIAATGARDGNDGLFFGRDPDLIRVVNLMTSEYKQGGFGENDCRRDNSRLLCVCVDGSMYRRTCRDSPLYQRAWIFQERFLSPRTIHFGRPQIIFECRTCVRYETFQQTRPTNFENWSTVQSRKHDFRRAWSIVVEDYSKTKLTISSDKLVALSGIAKHFANKYSSEYLAGIWKEHLPHALVWSADDEHGTGPLPLRGPSWSWASRNGSIRYDRIYSFVKTPFDDRPSSWTASDFKILDVQVQTTTSDSYGHCLGGEMRIECVKLIDGTGVSDGVYPGRSSKTIPIGDESFSINYYFDDRREHSKIFLLKIFTRIVQERSEAIYQWTPEIQGRPSPPSSHANGIHDCEEGLIIAPVVGRKGTFTRIGIYHLPGYIGTLQAFEDARSKTESLQEDELSLYEQGSGVNEAGNQSYVITLI